MWALVAEMEAMRTEVAAMQAHDLSSQDGSAYSEAAYLELSSALKNLAAQLREI